MLTLLKFRRLVHEEVREKKRRGGKERQAEATRTISPLTNSRSNSSSDQNLAVPAAERKQVRQRRNLNRGNLESAPRRRGGAYAYTTGKSLRYTVSSPCQPKIKHHRRCTKTSRRPSTALMQSENRRNRQVSAPEGMRRIARTAASYTRGHTSPATARWPAGGEGTEARDVIRWANVVLHTLRACGPPLQRETCSHHSHNPTPQVVHRARPRADKADSPPARAQRFRTAGGRPSRTSPSRCPSLPERGANSSTSSSGNSTSRSASRAKTP